MHNHLYNPEDGNEQRDHQRELPFEVRLGISTIRCCNNTVLPRRGRVGVRRVDCKDSVTAYWPIPAELTASAYADKNQVTRKDLEMQVGKVGQAGTRTSDLHISPVVALTTEPPDRNR
jgi:hypothetical protein